MIGTMIRTSPPHTNDSCTINMTPVKVAESRMVLWMQWKT